MKTFLIIFALSLVAEQAIAGRPAELAFERLQYEVSKEPAFGVRSDLFAEYLGGLNSDSDAPLSLSGCFAAIDNSQAPLRDCEPLSFQHARIGGGTGGVE